jgi:hypothetical protein
MPQDVARIESAVPDRIRKLHCRLPRISATRMPSRAGTAIRGVWRFIRRIPELTNCRGVVANANRDAPVAISLGKATARQPSGIDDKRQAQFNLRRWEILAESENLKP